MFAFPFKRKDKVKVLGTSSAIKVAPDRTIDTSLLYHRFLVVYRTGRGDISQEEVMTYELSKCSSSLLDDKRILQKTDKHQLAHGCPL